MDNQNMASRPTCPSHDHRFRYGLRVVPYLEVGMAAQSEASQLSPTIPSLTTTVAARWKGKEVAQLSQTISHEEKLFNASKMFLLMSKAFPHAQMRI